MEENSTQVPFACAPSRRLDSSLISQAARWPASFHCFGSPLQKPFSFEFSEGKKLNFSYLLHGKPTKYLLHKPNVIVPSSSKKVSLKVWMKIHHKIVSIRFYLFKTISAFNKFPFHHGSITTEKNVLEVTLGVDSRWVAGVTFGIAKSKVSNSASSGAQHPCVWINIEDDLIVISHL